MKVLITRKNGNLSDSLKSYIETRVSELDRHFPRIIEAHVIIDSEGKDRSIEVTLRVVGRTLVSRLISTNLRAAIDGCVDKLDKQLDKVKGKFRRKGRKSDELRSGQFDSAGEDIIEFEIMGEDQPLLAIESEELILESEEKTGTAD